ncbi:manganese efflux pump MntP family protein [Clostridium mediterraneense]|uniref:manganese efflux pump MntP n=1 Tax=Clostridium mediterraneense TaxID=1805472 RepID=UPI00082CDAD8|nr:manganese efflux pump [Clostridium mediterraneense]
MGYCSISILGVILALDAFAVALAKGISLKKLHIKASTEIGLIFGMFQGGMTIAGWFMGSMLLPILNKYKFIPALILIILGINIIYEALKNDSDTNISPSLSLKEIIPLGLLTSIDALALGVSLAFLNVRIVICSTIIGTITVVLCFIAVILGGLIGSKINSKLAEIIGGFILIAIGISLFIK